MRKRRNLVSEGSGVNVWTAFSDVTSTVVLILFVVTLLTFLRNVMVDRQLAASRQRMDRSRQQLSDLASTLKQTEREIEAGRRQLAESQEKIQQQRGIVERSKRELTELRSRLSGIALLRFDVLRQVKESIEGELGAETSQGTPLVGIGDNGNIVLNESLVFAYNSYALKKEGKVLLDVLAQALENLLSRQEARTSIESIVVQGHTDDIGSSTFNRELSSKRASAVLDYLFQVNPRLQDEFGSYFAASAYSEFRPIARGESAAARRENRRIEVSVVLRDTNVQSIIDDYTNNLDPALRADAGPPAQPERDLTE